MRPVALWLVAVSLAAAPAGAGQRDGGYDPCKNRGTRRIAVVYARSTPLVGGGECKGSVTPEKKIVCVGDTVQWSVVNTCDVEEVSDIRIEGLEAVAEKCTALRRLGVGAAGTIQCRLKRTIRDDTKQEYEVTGRIGKSRTIIDPELIIRRPI